MSECPKSKWRSDGTWPCQRVEFLGYWNPIGLNFLGIELTSTAKEHVTFTFSDLFGRHVTENERFCKLTTIFRPIGLFIIIIEDFHMKGTSRKTAVFKIFGGKMVVSLKNARFRSRVGQTDHWNQHSTKNFPSDLLTLKLNRRQYP